MESDTLERPAELAVWPTRQADRPLAGPLRFPSLRAAIAAAANLLSDPSREPWIVTHEGELLAPVRIRTILT